MRPRAEDAHARALYKPVHSPPLPLPLPCHQKKSKPELSPTATMVINHHIIGLSALKARMRSGGRREQVDSCHAVLRRPPCTIPGPLGYPPQQPMCMPIADAERRWLCRTAGSWPMQLAWVHPAPLDRLTVLGTEAAADEADATEAEADAEAGAEADAELEAVFPAIRVGRFRAGVTGGGGVGRPCPCATGLMARATR